MQIKFQQKITNYKYLLSFDLASTNTGVCLWDIQKNKPLQTSLLKVTGKQDLNAAELSKLIKEYFVFLQEECKIDINHDILVIKEAMPSQVHGGSSTVQTFIALARSHCVLDLFLSENNIPTYDYIGIYPITWHNYFKKLINGDKDLKITKELVHDYVVHNFGLQDDIQLDESDAVFMCFTFLSIKWNNDIQEQIREVKRHKKLLKAAHAIKVQDAEIERLLSLKN